jgi:hypothetical protein
LSIRSSATSSSLMSPAVACREATGCDTKLKSPLTECNRGNGDACQLPREEAAFGARNARVWSGNPYTEEDGAVVKAVTISVELLRYGERARDESTTRG